MAAAELKSHSLLLECYHPSAKLFEPPLFCAYRGTDGLSQYETAAQDEANIGARLNKMHNMYTRFRPHQRELEDNGRRVRPGDIPGSRTFPGTVQDRYEGETVKQTLSLESHELFTQLVAQTHLVKIGPRVGLFSSFVDVEEGVLRVWRKWLDETAKKGQGASEVAQGAVEEAGKGKGNAKGVGEAADVSDARILWVSPSKNTGIRFNVKQRRFRRDVPILIRVDEDLPVSYEIEYDGESRTKIHDRRHADMLCRAPCPDLASPAHTREVACARRQLVRQSRRIWFVWVKGRVVVTSAIKIVVQPTSPLPQAIKRPALRCLCMYQSG